MWKFFLRQMLPSWVFTVYHYVLAYAAVILYGFPSEKLFVIGVTGTNGKSTTVNFLGRILEHAGYRVGWTSTANMKIADQEWLNEKKMTMPGRFALQKLLHEMVLRKCDVAIIETSSEGIKQFRHLGINYDLAIFTNLTPEHLEAHGGFENYKHAKGKLFSRLARGKKKFWQGRLFPKTKILNADDPHVSSFLSFPTDSTILFGLQNSTSEMLKMQQEIFFHALFLSSTLQGSTFRLHNADWFLPVPGVYNVYNVLGAIAAASACGVKEETIREAVAHLFGVPGRFERIEEGQPFFVIVDYAPEPVAMRALYELVRLIPAHRIIHVLGSAGGGRDKVRRPILGSIAGAFAARVIVTNEDPYDEDPQQIIQEVAQGAREAGKREGEDLFLILDRKEAIAKALDLAEPKDLVLVTGKGCEQAICVANGKKILWDDRMVIRKILRKRYAS